MMWTCSGTCSVHQRRHLCPVVLVLNDVEKRAHSFACSAHLMSSASLGGQMYSWDCSSFDVSCAALPEPQW